MYKMFRTLKNCIQSILLYTSLKSKFLFLWLFWYRVRYFFYTFKNYQWQIYEVCPKSIRPVFISSRQSARLASAGYECNQWSLTNSLNAVVTGRTPWVALSVYLYPMCFFRSSHLFTVENDRKNRSTNLHQVLLQSRQELYGDD